MNTRLALARTLYVIMGTVALLAALAPIVASATSGCAIVLDQASMRAVTGPACTSFVSPAGAVAGLVIGGLTLAAAFWFGASDRSRQLMARAGIVVGGLATLTPGLLLVSTFDYSQVSAGLLDYVIAVVPVVLGTVAAVTLWRAGGRAGNAAPDGPRLGIGE